MVTTAPLTRPAPGARQAGATRQEICALFNALDVQLQRAHQEAFGFAMDDRNQDRPAAVSAFAGAVRDTLGALVALLRVCGEMGNTSPLVSLPRAVGLAGLDGPSHAELQQQLQAVKADVLKAISELAEE